MRLQAEPSCSNLGSAWERRRRFSTNKVLNDLTISNRPQCLILWVVQRFPVTWTHLCISSSCTCSEECSFLIRDVWIHFYIDFDHMSMSTCGLNKVRSHPVGLLWFNMIQKCLCALSAEFYPPTAWLKGDITAWITFSAGTLTGNWLFLYFPPLPHRWAESKVGTIGLCVECFNYTPPITAGSSTRAGGLRRPWGRVLSSPSFNDTSTSLLIGLTKPTAKAAKTYCI